jgi:hypothetical protein
MQLKHALNSLCLAAAAASTVATATPAYADALSEVDDYVGRSAQAVCNGLAAAADKDAVATELTAIADDSRRNAVRPFSPAEAQYVLAGSVNSNCPAFQPLLQSSGVYDAADRYVAAQRATRQGGATTPADLPGLAQATPGQTCTNTKTFVFAVTQGGQTLACLPSASPSYGLSAPVVGVRVLGAQCSVTGQLAQSTDGEPMMCLGTPGAWAVYRDL